jgi:hypothetical protein
MSIRVVPLRGNARVRLRCTSSRKIHSNRRTGAPPRRGRATRWERECEAMRVRANTNMHVFSEEQVYLDAACPVIIIDQRVHRTLSRGIRSRRVPWFASFS